MICKDAVIAGIILIIIALLILAHHAYKHRPGTSESLDFPDRCFQKSDFCRFNRWNHETVSMFIGFPGFIILACGLGMKCD
jgi:hypothetical protein